MKVVINGLNFTIKEVDEVEKNENGITLGLTKYVEQEILLLKRMSKEQKQKTLIHELTHAFLWAYGFCSIAEYPLEIFCDFVGIYAQDIVKIANDYFKEVNENETQNIK